MRISLASVKSIAFVMSPRLGDTLLAMIVVNNLQRNGYAVTVFSNLLVGLQRWFPGLSIKPYPDAATGKEMLQTFDLLLHSYPHDVLCQAQKWHPNVVVFDHFPLFRQLMSMVELHVAVCKQLFMLKDVVRDNGLIAPAGLQLRADKQRIIIHPMASISIKCWPLDRFITLASRLQAQGYRPEFVVAPAEKPQVLELEQRGFTIIANASLDTIAQYLYELGWFIGNDSGVGHLASNLGIPTISLMQRSKLRQRWRPDWTLGKALLPRVPLITGAMKEKYWKYFISVDQVLRAFAQLKATEAKVG